MPVIDLIGQRFGKLVVTERAGSYVRTKASGRTSMAATWKCLCDCGREVVARGSHLRSGNIASCGCLISQVQHDRLTTHGESRCSAEYHGSSEYIIWQGMKQRCCDPNAIGWERYGGRGIAVCDEWRESFETFLADMGRKPSPAHQIERKDNDGPYAPWNCEWATRREQALNRSSNRRIQFAGENLTVTEWAAKLGINRQTLFARINNWPIERALTETTRPYVSR